MGDIQDKIDEIKKISIDDKARVLALLFLIAEGRETYEEEYDRPLGRRRKRED